MSVLSKKNCGSVIIDAAFKKQIIYQYGCVLMSALNTQNYTPDIYINSGKVYVNLMGSNSLNIDFFDSNFSEKLPFLNKDESDIFQYSNIVAYIDATVIVDSVKNR